MAMPSDLKRIVLMEIDKLGDATFAGVADTLWDAYAVSDGLFTMSQFLYTKRHLLAVVMGQWYAKYDVEEIDTVEKQSQVFKNLDTMYQRTIGLIDANEVAYGVNTDPLIGLIRKATPLEYVNLWVDPSSILLSGSPLISEPYSLPLSNS